MGPGAYCCLPHCCSCCLCCCPCCLCCCSCCLCCCSCCLCCCSCCRCSCSCCLCCCSRCCCSCSCCLCCCSCCLRLRWTLRLRTLLNFPSPTLDFHRSLNILALSAQAMMDVVITTILHSGVETTSDNDIFKVTTKDSIVSLCISY